jgi:hypothetical protein
MNEAIAETLSKPREMVNRLLVGVGVAAAALALSGELAQDADAHRPCPTPSHLKRVSARCGNYLVSKLDNKGYDDVNNSLKVTTYQRIVHPGPVDGILGPKTGRAILRGRGMHLSRQLHAGGEKFLVDKHRQVAFIFNDRGHLRHTIAVATGSEQLYKSPTDHKINRAHTPDGRFRINSVEDGHYKSKLGSMPWARFFVGHIDAVHGGDPFAKSHGCVHVSNPTMVEVVNPNFSLGDRVTVREKVSL